MKNLFKFFLILQIIFFTGNLFAKIESKIILKVENEIITNYDVKNKIITTLVLSDLEINQDNINKLKKKSLDTLINSKLKKTELSKYNFNYEQSQLKSYLNRISNNDIQSLKDKFKSNNINYEIFLDEAKIEMKWQKLIYSFYSKKIDFSENNIDKEIEIIKNKQDNIKEYKISEIEIFINNDEDDKKIIDKIQKLIIEDGFNSTAQRYSISDTSINYGDLGWFNANSLSPNIYNFIKNLKIGEISKPIKKNDSVLILKLENIRSTKIKDIDEVKLKQNLINQKKNELFSLYSRNYLSKLRNISTIEYK